MSRSKKLIRNIVILIFLFFLFFRFSGIYLSPISAHEHSEKSILYGPSKVVHIENFDKGKYVLCKYDKWVSCNTVNRKLFFFWMFGNQPVGFEYDKNKYIDYTWGMTDGNYKLYGIINNKEIKEVQLFLDNGQVYTKTQAEFYDDLFLFKWESNAQFKIIRAVDSNNNIIYEQNNFGSNSNFINGNFKN